MIRKIAIRNYRIFEKFDLDFSPGINVLVGANDTGKSTIIEAINLALTARLNGRALSQELSPYLINQRATKKYVQQLRSGQSAIPPEIIVDVFLTDTEATQILRGTNNVYGEDACGVRIQAKFSQDFAEEYSKFIATPNDVTLAPTEYYRVEWLGFSGNAVSSRSVPATTSVIDAATIRLVAGIDYHLQQIIRTHLDPNERVELSRQYRSLREQFSEKETVKAINKRLEEENLLTDKNLSLAVDISHGWENSLAAHIGDIPYQLIGRGEQNILKTLLAIGRKANEAHIVLIEEPETHLSFTSLRKLISRIEERCTGKQVIVATHSAYVLNKLGLDTLVLLGDGVATRISQVPKETVDFFKKLAGFDTLRMVLADSAILVEGPSDELIIQRAYLDSTGRLPIDDGIDVISVALSHKRFLDLAIRLKRRVRVVTDNDGKTSEQMAKRFIDYLAEESVTLHFGTNPEITTLEPHIVDANDLITLNAALNMNYASKEEALNAMTNDKTGAALAIFESKTKIRMPDYIRSAISS